MSTAATPAAGKAGEARQPRPASAGFQDSMPSRYSAGVRALAALAFAYVVFAYLNSRIFHLFVTEDGTPPLWLSHWTEYVVIVTFGLWRTLAERNAYTRKRLAFLTTAVGVFWWIIPDYLRLPEPFIGALPGQPVFPQLHTPGTLTFFAVLLLVLLFGRRVICGWNCPCVGIREAVGFAFRDRTPRSPAAWRWRHLKWAWFALYLMATALILIPDAPYVSPVYRGFLGLVALPYFATLLLTPWIGNRSYCRFLCPYGATFGLLNRIGFFQVRMNRDQCIDCRRCEQVCDMAIPVWRQGREHGGVASIEECMGCGRCIVSCPTDALSFRDIRNAFRPGLVQNGSHLLKRPALPAPVPRAELPARRATAERGIDWREDPPSLDPAEARVQAARCLDCGVPECRRACPLGNRIPDWLAALAANEVEKAAGIMHATNNFPEVCGRLCPQHRLCEGACTRGRLDGAVTIGALERFAAGTARARGWRPARLGPPRRHGSVAVVGAGPAGLACADELGKAGVAVTVYDRNTEAGGLLTCGVPPFKVGPEVMRHWRRPIEEAGVRFQLGVAVDAGRMTTLLSEHDAVFLGTGAQRARAAGLPGEHLAGVVDGLSYLAAVNAWIRGAGTPPRELAGQTVLVLGGGDTAMDCARSALRHGASAVTIACRSGAERLRASPKEVTAAREEGAGFLFHHTPTAFAGQGRLTAVCFTAGSVATTVPCDTAVVAFGLVAAPPEWLTAFDIAVDSRGFIAVDGQGRTTHPKVFAGGDNTHGPDLVVTAVAAGRRAAHGILTTLAPAGSGAPTTTS